MNDTTQAMPVGQFLELLNKGERTPEEEQVLQQELLRQAREKAAKDGETQTASQPETAQEVNTQDAQVATPANMETPKEEQAQEENTEEKPYSIKEMITELQDAIDYLKEQDQTMEIEMALASFTQVVYWLERTQK